MHLLLLCKLRMSFEWQQNQKSQVAFGHIRLMVGNGYGSLDHLKRLILLCFFVEDILILRKIKILKYSVLLGTLIYEGDSTQSNTFVASNPRIRMLVTGGKWSSLLSVDFCRHTAHHPARPASFQYLPSSLQCHYHHKNQNYSNSALISPATRAEPRLFKRMKFVSHENLPNSNLFWRPGWLPAQYISLSLSLPKTQFSTHSTPFSINNSASKSKHFNFIRICVLCVCEIIIKISAMRLQFSHSLR